MRALQSKPAPQTTPDQQAMPAGLANKKAAKPSKLMEATAGSNQADVGFNFTHVPVFPALPIQAKLTVGATDDPLEHEADRVADQVMRMPDAEPTVSTVSEQISRKCEACDKEDQEKSELQMKPADSVGKVGGAEYDELQSSGQPLDMATRAFFEPRFGYDFSRVRVHTDSEAVQMNRKLSAQAFTYNEDIYFGVGKTPGKNGLTAHELTHVIQQKSGSPLRASLIQRDTNSTDYMQGYQDGRNGDESHAVPRDGDALTDYNEGYAKGHYEFSQSLNPSQAVPGTKQDQTQGNYGSGYFQADIGPLDFAVEALSDLAPITLPAVYNAPGDYPIPGKTNVAMAKRIEDAPFIQRQDNPDADEGPHLSADAQLNVPLSFQLNAIWRDLSGWEFDLNSGKLVSHKKTANPFMQILREPQVSLITDAQGFSLQEAVTLINLNWWPSWVPQIENGLSFQASQRFAMFKGQLPTGGSAGMFGLQNQTEFHLYGGFSMAGSLSLNIFRDGKDVKLAPSGMFSMIFHFDGGKYLMPERVRMGLEPPFGSGPINPLRDNPWR